VRGELPGITSASLRTKRDLSGECWKHGRNLSTEKGLRSSRDLTSRCWSCAASCTAPPQQASGLAGTCQVSAGSVVSCKARRRALTSECWRCAASCTASPQQASGLAGTCQVSAGSVASCKTKPQHWSGLRSSRDLTSRCWKCAVSCMAQPQRASGLAVTCQVTGSAWWAAGQNLRTGADAGRAGTWQVDAESVRWGARHNLSGPPD